MKSGLGNRTGVPIALSMAKIPDRICYGLPLRFCDVLLWRATVPCRIVTRVAADEPLIRQICAQHPPQIGAQQLLDIGLRQAGGEQVGGQLRQAAGIERRRDTTVEIRAETDVFDAATPMA